MTDWRLEPIFESFWLVAAVVAALALLMALTRPWSREIGWRRRAALAMFRSLAILLFALLLLRPTRVSQETRPQAATLVILSDASRSQQLPSGQSGMTRWQQQRQIFSATAGELAALAEEGVEVKAYRFDNELRSLEIDGGRVQIPAEAEGQATDIGTAIHAALRNELGKRLSAVILLSDGVQTAVAPEVEIHQAGRELARLGFPLYAISLGKADAASDSRDVAIENLQDQYTVFVNNELQVRAGLRARGYQNRPIEVKLIVEDAAGDRKVVGTQAVTAKDDDTLTPVTFNYTPVEVGQFQLTVAAEELDDELVTRNNQLGAFLSVREGGVRVLYVRGNNWFEQKFARRALAESPDIDLTDLFLDPRQRERWPVDLRGVLGEGEFDCVVLDDVDSSALRQQGVPQPNLKLLAEAVADGKGLLMVGGYHSFGPGGYQLTELREVLPIEIGQHERQEFGGPIAEDLHLSGPLTVTPPTPHFITQLAAGDAANQRFWASLKPFPGANRFAGLKDRAQVLLQTSDGMPILVAGEYGNGRVLALALDSTYTLWGQGLAEEHKRLWRQMILWLTRRDDNLDDEVWLSLPQRRFPPGARVEFYLGANDATGNALTDVEFAITVTLPDGTQQQITTSRDGQRYFASFRETQAAGRYQIEALASRGGRTIGKTTARFEIFDHDLELSRSSANPSQLARLADQTAAAGGKLITPEALPGLLEEIRNRRDQRQITVETRWQLGTGTTDAWLILLLLTGLFSAEWFLRKKWGLV